MAFSRQEQDPMEEDGDDEEVRNDDDVFQIAALVDGGDEGEDATAMDNSSKALLPLSAINHLVEPMLKVHVPGLKKDEEPSSSDSSSSFDLSEAGGGAEEGEDDEGASSNKKEKADNNNSNNNDASKGGVNSFIDKEIQYVPGYVTEISYSETSKIEYIGDVMHAMGTPEQRSLVIRHKGTSYGLDIDSVLCLADKSCLGVVNETFGPITQPFYRVYISKPHPTPTPVPAPVSTPTPTLVPTSDPATTSETPVHSEPVSLPNIAPIEVVAGEVKPETSEVPIPNKIEIPIESVPSNEATPLPVAEVPSKPKFPPLAKVEDATVGTRVYFVIDEKQYLHPNQLLLANQKVPEEEVDSEEVYFSDDEKEKEYNASKRKRKENEGEETRPNKKPRRDNNDNGNNFGGNSNRGGEGRGRGRGEGDRRGRGGRGGNFNNNNNNNNYNNNGRNQYDQGPGRGMPQGGGGGQAYYPPMMAPGYTQYHYPQYSNPNQFEHQQQGPRQGGGYGYNPQLPFQAMQPPPTFSPNNPYYQQQQQSYQQQQHYPQQQPQQGYASGGYQFAPPNPPQGGAGAGR